MSDAGREIEYEVRLRLPDGQVKRSGSFKTRRAREVGDFVNLPTGPDGSSMAGHGFIWRVRSIGDGGRTLVLDFEKPHDPA